MFAHVKISRARNNRVETGHEYSELLPQECRFKPLRRFVYYPGHRAGPSWSPK